MASQSRDSAGIVEMIASAFLRERCGGAGGDIHNDARARTNARRTDANASTDEQFEPATRSGLDEERPPVANPRLHSRSG